MLQLIAGFQQSQAVFGVSEQIARIVEGHCAYCESAYFIFIWQGAGTPIQPIMDESLRKLVLLLTSTDTRDVKLGLTQVMRWSMSEDMRALDALDAGIRQKAGDPSCPLYDPGLRIRIVEDMRTAGDHLRELARKGALLRDPAASGELIAAFVLTLTQEQLFDLSDEIESLGGPDQWAAFQLLYARSRVYANLKGSSVPRA